MRLTTLALSVSALAGVFPAYFGVSIGTFRISEPSVLAIWGAGLVLLSINLKSRKNAPAERRERKARFERLVSGCPRPAAS